VLKSHVQVRLKLRVSRNRTTSYHESFRTSSDLADKYVIDRPDKAIDVLDEAG
jgi:ATP-dependent Clp protease ATP-binding subunit ClpA